MEKVITNRYDAKMSIQAVNDMINVRVCMRILKNECLSLSSPMAQAYCAQIHKLMLGWT